MPALTTYRTEPPNPQQFSIEQFNSERFNSEPFSTEQFDMALQLGDPAARLGENLFLEAIIGAAVFDLNGLPKEYFTTAGNGDISWVQTIFQALGLRSLLISSLQIDGFQYATIHGSPHRAVVVKQRSRYVALLISQAHFDELADMLIDWMQEFDTNILKTDPRFCLV